MVSLLETLSEMFLECSLGRFEDTLTSVDFSSDVLDRVETELDLGEMVVGTAVEVSGTGDGVSSFVSCSRAETIESN